VKHEPWWIWHWDVSDAKKEDETDLVKLQIQFERVTRWRRGSLLTIYRYVMKEQVQWWFYGPFDLAVGFGYNKRA